MKRLICLGIGLLVYAIPVETYARPVSYPGGWTVSQTNNGEANTLLLHYSPTARYSLGYKFEYWRDGDFTVNALQMNNLLKRWNNEESQANLYLKSGIGIAHGDHETSPAAYTGLATDWEDRRFFASYENRYTEAGDVDDFFTQSARVGVAPYIGNYGDIHTWLMLEVSHAPENDEKITITPLVRFFKGVQLLEAGMTNHGEVLLNAIYRF